jgi:hypothetical protein
MEGIEAPCPLCGKTFSDDAEYAAHLAEAHGLVDDDGAEATSVEHALVASGIAADRLLAEAAAEEAAASKAQANGEAVTEVHPSRIYDPRADDSRLKPIVLGLAGLLLLGAIGLALVAGLGGDDDPGGGEVATDGSVDVDEPLAGVAATPTSAGDGADALVEPPSPPATDPGSGALVTTPPAVAVPPPAPTTTRPPAPPTTPRPAVTAPPTVPPATSPPPPPPTTAPPTTARPFFAPPALSGARIDSCERSGPDATWTFSYVLSGGSGWAPAPGATAAGGGRYVERRGGKASRGFPATSIQVVDVATGQPRSINLSPSLAGADCR